MEFVQWRFRLRVSEKTEWSRYWIVAGLVMSLSIVPLKSRRVKGLMQIKPFGAQTSSGWWGVVVRRGSDSSGVILVT
ncbi:hypothetical protein TNCV_2442921 [Trichonephila clavipes]|nr:hypothetical protein TNCV_2442921 [Trichonephila clavipes]